MTLHLRPADVACAAGESRLSFARARELLSYDPLSGQFTWVHRRPGVREDLSAGWINSGGYVCLRVDGRVFRAHRLAWLLMTGAWPELQIDHRNTIRSDNRWDNLRVISGARNNENQHRAHRSNKTSGVLGVSWNKKDRRWAASISVANKRKFLGNYLSIDEAAQAYQTAKAQLHAGYVP